MALRIPELAAVLDLPHSSVHERVANSGRFIELANVLKDALEAPDGVRIPLLNTPGVFGNPNNREKLLSVARTWATWGDAAENVVFYAVLCVWWVALGPDGCPSIAAAGVIEPLMDAAMTRTGGYGSGSAAAMRVCSIIERVVAQQAPLRPFGAPPEVLASFGARILALFPGADAYACKCLDAGRG
jgi:hypothetical protein